MSDEQPQDPSICATEAIDLLNCLAADQYVPENCQQVFTSFRKCIFANQILEFGVIGHNLEKLPALPHVRIEESPKSSCKN
jgi:hypothetical protein